MPEWTCGACGEPVESGQQEEACSKCGSTARTRHVITGDAILVRTYEKAHAKHREGDNKIVREVIAGDDFYRKSETWNLMYRLIDRTIDWYEEVFRNRETGEIIHKKAERLSEHRTKIK